MEEARDRTLWRARFYNVNLLKKPRLLVMVFSIVSQASGNKVSRQTVLCGSQNIVLNGKVIVQSDAIIRGDLANVRVGRYCIISRNSVIRPPFKKFSKGFVASCRF